MGERLKIGQTGLTIEEYPLAEGTSCRVEILVRPDLKTAGALGIWGTRRHLDPPVSAGDRTVDTLFQTDVRLSLEEAVHQERQLAQALAERTLKVLGWQPEDVEFFAYGSGTPPDPDEYHLVAQRLGLSQVLADPSRLIASYLACNSGWDAVARVCEDPRSRDAKVLALAVEGLTRLVKRQSDTDFSRDRLLTDKLSEDTFSNGIAAWGFVPGKTFVPIKTIYTSDLDHGALAAVTLYRKIMEAEGDFVQELSRNGRVKCVRMPAPPDEYAIYMKGGAAAKFFLRLAEATLQEAQTAYLQMRTNDPVFPEGPDIILTHHASPAVIALLENKIRKAGINATVPWLITEGNMSGATTLIALLRLFPQLKGETILVLSFGAGATATSSYIKMGGLVYAPT